MGPLLLSKSGMKNVNLHHIIFKCSHLVNHIPIVGAQAPSIEASLKFQFDLPINFDVFNI